MTSPVLSVKTPYGRFYEKPSTGKQVPSITNVIGMMDKPALVGWAAKMSAEFAVDNIDVLQTLINSGERQAAIDMIKGSRYRKSNDAANKGDSVHNWIDDWIKAGTPDLSKYTPEDYDDAHFTPKNMWRQFGGLVNKYHPEFLMSEFSVWSDKYEYAGTGDFIARIGNAVVYGDWKTGNGVYSSVGLQISALSHADYILDANGNEQPLPPCDRGAVGHIRPTFSRLSPVGNLEENFKAFLGLRAVFEWHTQVSESVLGGAPKIEVRKEK